MADPRLRQIKIKTGVVRRLAKEKVMYEKEAKQQEEKIEKMKAEACDDYGIKKQIEILQESRMMIPDCQRRLEIAHADLSQLLAENESKCISHSNETTMPYLPEPNSAYTVLKMLSWQDDHNGQHALQSRIKTYKDVTRRNIHHVSYFLSYN
ncbi:Tbca [Columba guinea]|nr:Tbca [Columba guinea]